MMLRNLFFFSILLMAQQVSAVKDLMKIIKIKDLGPNHCKNPMTSNFIESIIKHNHSNAVARMNMIEICPQLKSSCCNELDFEVLYTAFTKQTVNLMGFKKQLIKTMQKSLNSLDLIENYELYNIETKNKCRFNLENIERIFHEILLENQQVLNSIDMYFDNVIFYHSGFGCQICNSDNSNFLKFDEFNKSFYIDIDQSNLNHFFVIYPHFIRIVNHFQNIAKIAKMNNCLNDQNLNRQIEYFLGIETDQLENLLDHCRTHIYLNDDPNCINLFSQQGFFDKFKGFEEYEESYYQIDKILNDFLNLPSKKYTSIHPIKFYGQYQNRNNFEIFIPRISKRGWMQDQISNQGIIQSLIKLCLLGEGSLIKQIIDSFILILFLIF